MIVDNTYKILKKYEAFARKKFGQNFLINKDVLERIVHLSDLDKQTAVIEIGPGLGTLTEYLAINAGAVMSYEIDPDMIEILKDTLKDYSNVKIIFKDFLKANINEDIAENLGGFKRIVVVANIPYYITTPIIFKLLGETNISEYLFMVQKEVGQRLAGRPSTKDYNALSVLMALKTNTEVAYKVPKNSFHPEPKVESVLLSVKVVKNDLTLNNEANFIEFTQVIFSQRRKTLVNNLSNGYKISREKVCEVLENLGFNINVRAEQLDVNQIYKIYKSFEDVSH